MCGIAGFAGQGSRADLERMTASLVHRGPDDAGVRFDDDARVHLGFRRLAIIDIAGGRQPMANETGDVHVVFNGEIYNHSELRAQLVARGHRFATDHADTEVLVHGWEEWGEDLPLRLNGMFAFAIHDARKRRLFLARDRFGEKPLYYCDRPGVLAFASELTALACHPGVSRNLAPAAVAKLFAYGFVPAPFAMLEGTAKLAGGHWLSRDLATGATVVTPYWRFAIEPDESLGDADEHRLVDELEALIATAARRRLMSDVPVGIFLSGGLDSSTLLAALAQGPSRPELATFTIGFTEPSFDESEPARIVARHLRTEHHEQILDLETARQLLPEVLSRLDEPLGDASILPTYLLSRFAREKVTVALTGDGADELFAGYDPFAALAPAGLYDHLVPRLLHRGLVRIADLLPISNDNMSFDFKLRRTLMGLGYPERMRLPVWMAPLEPRTLAELLETRVDPEEVYAESIALWCSDPKKSTVDRALEYFTCLYLRDDILTKSDRASMMNSLETRAIFLDNDLVEFCRRLPNRFKYRNGVRKYLLRRVAERRLPPEILARPKKGFGIPLAKWLRSTPAEVPLAHLAGVDSGYAARAWHEHRSGKRDHRLFLWSWLALQAFERRMAQPQIEKP